MLAKTRMHDALSMTSAKETQVELHESLCGVQTIFFICKTSCGDFHWAPLALQSGDKGMQVDVLCANKPN